MQLGWYRQAFKVNSFTANARFVKVEIASKYNELAHGNATPTRLLPNDGGAVGDCLSDVIVEADDTKQAAQTHEWPGEDVKESLDEAAKGACAKPLNGLVYHADILVHQHDGVRNLVVAAVVAVWSGLNHSQIIAIEGSYEKGYNEGMANELSWQAPEFEATERSANWYVWSLVVAVILIILALIQKNILFALFVVIAEVVLISLTHGQNNQRLYSLNEQGLFVDHHLLRPLTEVGGFSFLDLGGRYAELILRPSKKLHTYTRVLILHERVPEVSEFLDQYFHSFEYQPTLADAIARWLRL